VLGVGSTSKNERKMSVNFLATTHCNALHLTAPHCDRVNVSEFSCNNTLQHAVPHCTTLYSTATVIESTSVNFHSTAHGNTLQHAAPHCTTRTTLHHTVIESTSVSFHSTTNCNTLQHAKSHCTIVQHTVPHCD